MKIRTNVNVRGLVQGVSFRYYTQQTAQRLNVAGWVRNLPDGSVQGCFEGEEGAVNSLIDWCRTGPPASQVERVNVEKGEWTGEFQEFTVKR